MTTSSNFDRIGLVIGRRPVVLLALARARRLAGLFGFGGVVLLVPVAGRSVGGFGRAFLQLLGGVVADLDLGALAGALLLGFAVLLLLVLGGLVLVVLVLLVVLALAGLLGHVERGEHVAHGAGEGALVLDRAREPVEIGPGLGLDRLAPEIDDLLRRLGRLQPGQPLAHHQRQRVLERRVGAVGDLLIAPAAVIFILQHGGDVAGHAGHAARADAFHPRLLDRVEDGARRIAFRRGAAMHRRVMAGQPQRHRIGMAAQHRDVIGRQLARRLRQARAFAHQRGFVRSEDDLHLRLAGDRLHRARDRPLQRLDGRFLRLAWLAIG